MEVNTNYKLLVISTSTIHGSPFLAYIKDELVDFIETDELIFVPFARPSGISYDNYTANVQAALVEKGIQVKGLHVFENKKEAIQEAKAIFIGGGNTFLLLKTLYDLDLMEDLKNAIANGIPYVGTSAGSNLTGLTIGTTNDMPIVYPPSFDALQLLPFNLNPHYLDPDPNSTHKGETRETRIHEFHQFNNQAVLGLREGSWLYVSNAVVELRGKLQARLFQQGKEPIELNPGQVNF
ncbi:dipeptidase PepE [Sphingobacterium sp. SRCM116780]|uniref:dipeptidase PepE n=1 Tax=Sphingobacterium sp. SRCM116780 TaxID=2907623 RepID=UPI001F19D4B1|nr:dipeptidase PepE [Sphingobacterium sp. SRCM116780]UIR57210.1 dipeptidase PepE [Sphingobacterium sp. SRCM116780]